jgi:uracil-DNA glycosylase
MHIIIEGTDKCGKSTLALELAKRLYMPVINRLKPKENIFIECIDFFTETESPLIIDRLHLSEQAYGPVKRNGSKFDEREFYLTEMSALMLGTFNIFCHDSLENIEKRCASLKEDFIKGDEIGKVLSNFHSVIENDSILKWHYYTIGDSIDELAEKIKKHFDEIRTSQRYRLLSEYRTVGNPEAEYLIYGERYGDSLKMPLIPFGNNSPGLFLFKSLRASKLKLNEIMISNIFKSNYLMPDVDDEAAAVEEMKLPNVKKVICLGNESYNETMRIATKNNLLGKVEIVKVYHPSYVTQYSDMSLEDYTSLINSAVSL